MNDEADITLDDIREIFIGAMAETVLDDEAREAGGALVSLTEEYVTQIVEVAGGMFDRALAAHMAGGA